MYTIILLWNTKKNNESIMVESDQMTSQNLGIKFVYISLIYVPAKEIVCIWPYNTTFLSQSIDTMWVLYSDASQVSGVSEHQGSVNTRGQWTPGVIPCLISATFCISSSCLCCNCCNEAKSGSLWPWPGDRNFRLGFDILPSRSDGFCLGFGTFFAYSSACEMRHV